MGRCGQYPVPRTRSWLSEPRVRIRKLSEDTIAIVIMAVGCKVSEFDVVRSPILLDLG